MPAKGLAVVDGVDQARAWLSSPLPGFDVLAAGPDAEYELEKGGVKARLPEEFYGPEDCRALKDETMARVYALCADLDARARAAAWPDLPAEFKPFFAFVFQARHVVDQVRFTKWRLERAKAAYAELAYLDTPREAVPEHLFFTAESAWSRAAQALGGRRVGPDALPAASKASLPRKLRDAYRSVKEGFASGGRELVLLNRAYSLGALGEEAAKNGVAPRYLEPQALEAPFGASNAALEKVWADFVASGAFKDVLDGGEIDRRLRYMAVELAPRAEAIFRRASSWLARRQAAAAVGATMNWREKIVAQACRAKKVPFVVWVHGNIGTRHSEAVYHNDLAFADLYLVNGEAQKEYCLKTFPESKAKVEAVGSAALDRIAGKLTVPPAHPRPLWIYPIGGIKDLRYPQYHRMPSDSFKLHKAVADAFAKRPDLDLCMKLYGGELWQSPIARYVADKGYKNVWVIDNPPFSMLLVNADGFLIDFPSTTLCEMALTDRPIIHLDALSHLDWLPEAMDAVKKRCAFVSELSQLDGAIAEKAKSDRAYLEGYGTKPGGGSAARAWSAIRTLAKA